MPTKAIPRASTLVETPTLIHLISETIFAIACIAQCATNWSRKEYVGLASACHFQGAYAGYYVFSATALTAVSTLATSSIVCKPESARFTSRTAISVGLLVHVVAILLASLPAMGVGEYIFPRDFCMPNIESGMFSGLMFTWWLVSASGCLCAAWRAYACTTAPWAVRHLLAGVLIYYLISWLPLVLIIFVYWLDGSVAAQTSWVQDGVGLYGYLALVLHTNQLVIPLLVGWRLRAHMSTALSGLPLSATAPIDTEPRVDAPTSATPTNAFPSPVEQTPVIPLR